MQAVILCGGKGTRLGELTKDKPKCLLEVGDTTMIDWVIERLLGHGYNKIVICSSHKKDVLLKHMADTWWRRSDIGATDGCGYKVVIAVSEETEGAPMGTGGALRSALRRLDDKFLVTYGDTYLPFDYAEPMRELVGRQDCDAVMTVYKEGPGNVWCGTEFAAGVFSEKRVDPPKIIEHVDYGAIAMTRKIVEGIPYNLAIPLNRVLNGYAEVGRVRVIEAHEPYHTINTPEELAATDAYMRTL